LDDAQFSSLCLKLTEVSYGWGEDHGLYSFRMALRAKIAAKNRPCDELSKIPYIDAMIVCIEYLKRQNSVSWLEEIDSMISACKDSTHRQSLYNRLAKTLRTNLDAGQSTIATQWWLTRIKKTNGSDVHSHL